MGRHGETMPAYSGDVYGQALAVVLVGPFFFSLSLCVDAACKKKQCIRVSDEQTHPPRRRILYFDVWRAVCVLCVLVTHADESYANYNVGAVQQWVLNFILLISGTLYGMSKPTLRHLLHYVSRLLLLFSVGSGFNWAGAVIGDQEWNDVPDHICFQMAFILIMAFGAVVSYPLKKHLDAPSTCVTVSAIALYAVMSIGCFVAFVHVVIVNEAEGDADMLFRGMYVTFFLLFVATAGHVCLPETWRGVLGWVVLLLLFTQVVCNQMELLGYWWHLIDIYNWAILVQRVPLMHGKRVGYLFSRGWPLLAVIGNLLSQFPGHEGRSDKYPFEELGKRLRYYVTEMGMSVGFITIPYLGPTQTIAFPEEIAPHLPWVTYWSLLTFSSHKAVYYAVGGLPFGLLIVLGSIVPFYSLWWWCTRKRREVLPIAAACEPADVRGSEAQPVDEVSRELDEEGMRMSPGANVCQ